MRKSYVLGLALVAVFAFSAFAASSAFAESEWLVSGLPTTDEVPVENESIGEILLEDMGISSDVDCTNVLSLGIVGELVNEILNTKLDLVETIEFMEPLVNCKILSGACTELDSPGGVTAVHLPWLTELLLVGGVFLNDILSEGAGAPGYRIECMTLLGLMADECTTEAGSADIDNNATAGDVVALFNETGPVESEFANCTIGGNLKGLVVGEVLVFTESGLSLAVS